MQGHPAAEWQLEFKLTFLFKVKLYVLHFKWFHLSHVRWKNEDKTGCS